MLNAHFLNVGKGNCSMINFPSGRNTIVDIDNSRLESDDSLTDPIQYYKANFGKNSAFRFILTHPDMDHMSGLNELYREISFGNFWDTENNKSIKESDWDNSPYDKNDWYIYQGLRRRKQNPTYLNLYQKATSQCCWIEDCITILSPTQSLVKLANDTEEYNHLSYVLKFEYAGVKFLLEGMQVKKHGMKFTTPAKYQI